VSGPFVILFQGSEAIKGAWQAGAAPALKVAYFPTAAAVVESAGQLASSSIWLYNGAAYLSIALGQPSTMPEHSSRWIYIERELRDSEKTP
jgi:hypothetical protein